eukprot:m.156103 g.156103  ORF g.156103 m.156103 type:complete len:509 (+) comp15094_c1_seq10:137-1663(+)
MGFKRMFTGLLLLFPLIHASHQEVTLCNVQSFGAKCDGHTIDTVAVQKAFLNTSCTQGVMFPKGKTCVCGSLKLRSNLVVHIEEDAVLLGAPKGNYDPPEPNPWSAWQDFGHSHWQNSLLWGIGVENVTLQGDGTIDGVDLPSSNPPPGMGDKLIALKSSSHITISGLTMRNTGHFAILATNVEFLTLSHLTLRPTRDGIDLVSVRNAVVEYVDIVGGGDDAFVLKSDYSVGKVLNVSNITIRNSHMATIGATALEIGSETVGDFFDIFFENISVTSAGDAGIGIVTMDGSNVYNIHYKDIVMTGITSAFQYYIGSRLLRPMDSCQDNVCTPGYIRNILMENVVATKIYDSAHGGRNWSNTIDGQPKNVTFNASRTYMIGPNITFRNLSLTMKGLAIENNAVCLNPTHLADKWMNIGPRPSWGLYIRNAFGIELQSISLNIEHNTDTRPAIVLENATDITFTEISAQRANSFSYDIGLDINTANISAIGLTTKQLKCQDQNNDTPKSV